ncbi:Uncharacterized protein Rs2_02776 [Raphanus sativus]|nr:Uncharacterized protein Rs2_02776 [Raphanus sativus]
MVYLHEYRNTGGAHQWRIWKTMTTARADPRFGKEEPKSLWLYQRLFVTASKVSKKNLRLGHSKERGQRRLWLRAWLKRQVWRKTVTPELCGDETAAALWKTQWFN